MPMFSPAYKRYVLGTLALVYLLNFLDRGLIGLLLEPIKHDLHLSDTQLGFLTGIAFALFYATLGLPLARWADRGNRVTIASLSLGLWSATMMACLFVSSFIHLVCARIAAAVGEAGSMPPTYSLIGDYFPAPVDRARAMAIYMSAGPLSSLISFALGGWLNDLYGWRMAFFLMGMPAVAVALLVRMTVVEPRLQGRLSMADKPRAPRMVHVLDKLWRQRSSRHLIVAITLLWTLGLGMAPWYAAFLMRTHGMSTTELGLWLGLVFSLGGVIGIVCGGQVATRWFAENERAQMRLSALMIALLVPCYVLFLLLPQKHQALMALALLVAVFSFFIAPTFSLMQRLVDDTMRATTLAVTMLLANLIGMGLGPQIVGILSDSLTPALQGDALRYAMLIVSLFAVWSAWHFWQASRTVADDLATAAGWTAA
jgi:predicted MFS family arabinose efflux permease